LFDVFFCVTLEQPESRILVVKDNCFLAIDCAVPLLPVPHECVEYRDNATSMPRWLGIRDHGTGKVYSLFSLHSVKANVYRFITVTPFAGASNNTSALLAI